MSFGVFPDFLQLDRSVAMPSIFDTSKNPITKNNEHNTGGDACVKCRLSTLINGRYYDIHE